MAIQTATRLGSAKGVNCSAKRASCPICALASIMPRPSTFRTRPPEDANAFSALATYGVLGLKRAVVRVS